ncbi:MAG: DUF86 domain-containing protein [Methanomassiliicoccaceae archaeon]|nr:DUF86 domain-containing protein [Methanomassiliicoccaceae archaeon]
MRDDMVLLKRIQNYCCDIEYDINRFGDSFDDFMEDPTYRRSVCLTLMQISETSKNLTDVFKTEHPEIDWPSIMGFRILVAHKYHDVDYVKVWEIASTQIRELMNFCGMVLSRN